MQTALRFLNRYAGLQAIQDTIKKMTADEVVERIFFSVLVLANVFILLYPIVYF
jgi:hypothetical protein